MLADGYILESLGDEGEVILSHADFLPVKAKLAEMESWVQVVGSTLFGGTTWMLRHDLDN